MRFRQYKIVKVLDRMPAFFVDWLTGFAKREMGKSVQRYVLLIEDLGQARVGDQVAGASADACGQVLEAVAEMHARFWGGEEIAPLPWLQDNNVNPRMRHRMYLESRPAFEVQHAEQLAHGASDLLAWIDANGVKLARTLHREAPETLIHCDLRLDNVFFDPAHPDAEVILADWQLVGRGAGAYDVAYLLSGALDADAPAEVERALLERYHARLLEAGVTGYDFDRFLLDYRRSLPAVFQILATTESMDLGEERGAELMGLWVERALARLRGVDLGTLL
jgi:aminoglycoside/choline kinase family phosphotransferase